jgi:hypothetical protein
MKSWLAVRRWSLQAKGVVGLRLSVVGKLGRSCVTAKLDLVDEFNL